MILECLPGFQDFPRYAALDSGSALSARCVEGSGASGLRMICMRVTRRLTVLGTAPRKPINAFIKPVSILVSILFSI